ncbi:MAG: hypothetical protein L6Q37_06855 [Bdellovibrionaceae bacterium]|nr:hypothetical protein [Pseudobdellovibrionaceae bacterium]NUM59766.1 hypothetical protein [Pseudobdellovibrionaceae bacterium]
MKLLITFTFIIISLISTSSVALESHFFSEKLKSSTESSLVSHSVVTETQRPVTTHSTESSHAESNCHHCHMGHCAFTISSLFNDFLTPPRGAIHLFEALYLISDFNTNPFRPPIC